jgi:ABC-type nitrate/sulfonate/bicarbonate transport system substrate-binding protein
MKGVYAMAHKAGRRGSAVIAAVAAAVTLAACGSNSSGNSSGSSGPVKLTIAVAATVGDFAPLYVAESQGYFAKNGVDLTVIPNALANTLPYLTSGRADLAMYSATIALSAAEQGKATSIVLLTERQPGFALVGSKNTTSLSQLKSESNCRYGVPQQGTSGYGVAATLFASLGLHCQFVITPDPATMVAEIDSGSMNAGVLLASNADQAKSQGASILIDPRNAADRQKYFTEETPTASVFGVTANLHKKRQGVVGFIKAMNDACVYIDSHSDAEVVADLIKADSSFATTPTPTLITNFASSQRPYMCQGLVGPVLGDRIGYISNSAWNTALQTYKAYGITGFDTSAAVNSYSERVDMSYYNSAVPAKS